MGEWDTQEWVQQLSFLTSNFNIVPSSSVPPSFPPSSSTTVFSALLAFRPSPQWGDRWGGGDGER